MKRLIRSSTQVIQASHGYVSDPKVMRLLASDLFEFMNTAYRWIGGFKSFSDSVDFADRSLLWYITYDGKMPEDQSKIDLNKVYTVSVYKKKNGLKLVGVGNNRFDNIEDKDERMILKSKARDALVDQIEFAARKGWAEVSGSLESLFKSILSPKQIIDPEFLKTKVKGFEDIEILPDNIHYDRILSSGDRVTKVAYGNIRTT